MSASHLYFNVRVQLFCRVDDTVWFVNNGFLLEHLCFADCVNEFCLSPILDECLIWSASMCLRMYFGFSFFRTWNALCSGSFSPHQSSLSLVVWVRWLRGLGDEVWATRFRKRAPSACVWAGAAFSCLQYGLVFPGHSGASVCGFPALRSGPAVTLERKKKNASNIYKVFREVSKMGLWCWFG